jgi:hypothetical protein
MTYFTKLPPDQLRAYQKKSQQAIQMRHLIRCKEAAMLFDKYKDIKVVSEKLGVKRAQAYRLVSKGKEL